MNVIEKMAQAVSAEGGFKSVTYPEKLAQAAYTAMMQHLAETKQVIVPEEPTEAMLYAGMDVIFDVQALWEIYRAMIAAAKDQA